MALAPRAVEYETQTLNTNTSQQIRNAFKNETCFLPLYVTKIAVSKSKKFLSETRTIGAAHKLRTSSLPGSVSNCKACYQRKYTWLKTSLSNIDAIEILAINVSNLVSILRLNYKQ